MNSTDDPRRSGPLARLKGHLQLARISNAPTVVTNVLAAAALAAVPLASVELVAMLAAMLLFYTGGMYLNDVFDVEYDRQHRPERPIPSGTVSRDEATITGVASLVAGEAILWTQGSVPSVCGLALVGLIVLYDWWHRDNPVAAWLMGSIRAMVYVTVFLALGGVLSPLTLMPAVLLALYIVGLTSLAAAENDPERYTMTPMTLLVAPAVWALVVGSGLLVTAVAALFLGWVAFSVGITAPDREFDVGQAVGRLLAGICLVDALVLAVVGSAGGVAVAVVAFGVTRLAHRWVAGT